MRVRATSSARLGSRSAVGEVSDQPTTSEWATSDSDVRLDDLRRWRGRLDGGSMTTDHGGAVIRCDLRWAAAASKRVAEWGC
jgi:hypothetical protein